MDFEEYCVKFEGATGNEYLAYTVGFEEGKLWMMRKAIDSLTRGTNDKDS